MERAFAEFSVRGWAKGLTMVGGGPYQVVGANSIDEALLMAARAMRLTGRPVGLLVWRGRHAWVTSGFRHEGSDAAGRESHPGDRRRPAVPVRRIDHGDAALDQEALSVSELGQQFVRRRRSTLNPSLSNKYVIVMPFEFHRHVLRLHGLPTTPARGDRGAPPEPPSEPESLDR